MLDVEDERIQIGRCQALFAASIAAKLRAAAGVRISNGNTSAKVEAHYFDKWFRATTGPMARDFEATCEAAGVDSDWLREQYAKHGPKELNRRLRKHIMGLSGQYSRRKE